MELVWLCRRVWRLLLPYLVLRNLAGHAISLTQDVVGYEHADSNLSTSLN
jgi:hypothetical protein